MVEPGDRANGAEGDLELARARLWQLLGLCLRAAPDAATLRLIAGLRGDASPLGMALGELAARARTSDPARLAREHHDLFIGLARGELVPYASYYLTGFLHEKPLAVLRGDMAALGIARTPGLAEPEDHIASLAESMAGLIAGDFTVDAAGQQRFFERHIAPWAERFFADLEGAAAADFYRPVGTLGRQLIGIETTAYALAA